MIALRLHSCEFLYTAPDASYCGKEQNMARQRGGRYEGEGPRLLASE